MAKKHPHIKAQDILLLVKLLICEPELKIVDLATDLGLSSSEVSEGVRRLQSAKLIKLESRVPLLDNAFEVLVHAVKYMFPGKLGEVTRGLPTAHSASPLSEIIQSSDKDIYVWPCEEGAKRGQSITPLYSSVPKAALKDKKLYELLSLLEAIRVGRARERKIAEEELKKIIFDE